jgi:hypothetical protein
LAEDQELGFCQDVTKTMIGNPTTIAGIPLPSDAPLFLAFIALHIAAGLTAVIAGAVAMLSRKRPGRHPQAGTVYYSALAVMFVTMSAAHSYDRDGRVLHPDDYSLLYVDNGPNPPLWRELPPLAFWILPTLIGAPILINALLRHPLVRQLGRTSPG